MQTAGLDAYACSAVVAVPSPNDGAAPPAPACTPSRISKPRRPDAPTAPSAPAPSTQESA
jgi:hypothetical protein